MAHIDECSEQLTIGFMLSALICRFILQGAGYPQEIIDTINHQSLGDYLRKLTNGNLIIQDQVLSGLEFDPNQEAEFQNIALQLLIVFDQAKEKRNEPIK